MSKDTVLPPEPQDATGTLFEMPEPPDAEAPSEVLAGAGELEVDTAGDRAEPDVDVVVSDVASMEIADAVADTSSDVDAPVADASWADATEDVLAVADFPCSKAPEDAAKESWRCSALLCEVADCVDGKCVGLGLPYDCFDYAAPLCNSVECVKGVGCVLVPLIDPYCPPP